MRRQRTRSDGHFGDRLFAARIDLGLTQQDVAQQAGIPYRTYQEWEENKHVPHAGKALSSVARVLEVLPSYLLFGDKGVIGAQC